MIGDMHLLSNASASISSLFVPLAILLGLTGLLLAILSVVRRKVRDMEVKPKDFSLTDLRELHRSGQMTSEEFERAKALLVGKVQSDLAKEVKPSRSAEPMHVDVKSPPGSAST